VKLILWIFDAKDLGQATEPPHLATLQRIAKTYSPIALLSSSKKFFKRKNSNTMSA
jgi:hypothetical protein